MSAPHTLNCYIDTTLRECGTPGLLRRPGVPHSLRSIKTLRAKSVIEQGSYVAALCHTLGTTLIITFATPSECGRAGILRRRALPHSLGFAIHHETPALRLRLRACALACANATASLPVLVAPRVIYWLRFAGSG